MSHSFTESIVEEATLAWLEGLGYTILSGPEIAPGEPFAERERYGQVILERRLRQALQRLNPQAPPDALDEAFRKLTRPGWPSLAANNHAIHRYLVEGVPVEYQRPDGSIGGDLVHVFDYDAPHTNEFVAVNQFTVIERPSARAGCGAVCQRSAAGGDRVEERRRRKRHGLDGLQQERDLQTADPGAVLPPMRRWSSPTACRPTSAR